MRLLVCGSRNWSDRNRVRAEIECLAPTVVIHGGAKGADEIADDVSCAWALETGRGISVEACHADWRQGKKAGPIRNARMLAEGKPDRGLAFGALWKRAGVWLGTERWKHTGTGDMVAKMIRAGLPVRWIAAPDAASMDLNLGAMPGPP